jgi:hypothetical protein
MVSKLNMVLQGIRDIALIAVSVLIMSTSYSQLGTETAHYVLFSIASVFFILSIINITLLLKKVTWKGYYYFNAIAQLLPAFMLTLFGSWIGPPFLTLNVAILVTLIERKKKQEPEQSKQA